MAAAFELTRPTLPSRYEVTLYQMGWRLGGKGASGRGACGRIEEHGLHLWMGYYENAFRLMRECYSELARDPRASPVARWSDAFAPANFNAVTDWTPTGRWLPWLVDFRASPGLPGDPDVRRWTVPDYLAQGAALVRTALQTLETKGSGAHRDAKTPPPPGQDDVVTPETLTAFLGRILQYGALAGIGACIEAVRVLESALKRAAVFPQSLLARVLDAIASLLRNELNERIEKDDSVRRLWEVIDLTLAAIRGSIRFRLALDPRGFDAIDEYDSREWLRMNGASAASIDSALVRGLYDLAFAYEQGDPNRPRIAAGTALRGAFRAFFTYRGAFFWKMTAGMGDIVFAPLYEVLRRRGVKFEFFHKLTNVRLSAPASKEDAHVAALEFDVQAHTVDGRPYAPLVDVGGLPCWPSEPRFEQLLDGQTIRDETWDLESQWDTRRAATRTLRVAKDYDIVVLGTSIGVLPYVCSEILERDARWRDMIDHVRSVPTQAFQIWMDRSMPELGWMEGPVNVSGFVEPFDTWADMSHLASAEGWREPPRSIAYFCNVLADADPSAIPSELVASQREAVRESAMRFLNHDIGRLWPMAHASDGEFRWDALKCAPGSECERAVDGSRFSSQFWTANVRPSDRYSQALPGSTKFRISPLDRTYDNLTIAGDWTSCGLNMGCVEAAVMSGLLAAHAVAQWPPLSDIVGYDHP